MSEKKTIIHVIDSLTCGGAELLLRNTISLMPEQTHMVIYLHGPEDLKSSFDNGVLFICLHYQRAWKLLSVIGRLRNIINKTQPVLVHSHLLLSSVIARLAVPHTIPLFNSLHSIYSIDAFSKNKKGLWAEKLTLRKRHTLIGVSRYVIADYLKWVPFRGKAFVLYNFIPASSFLYRKRGAVQKTFRCVAVGSLKEAKNYFFLLHMFTYLKELNVSLDIYGIGALEAELSAFIKQHGLNVHFKGQSSSIETVLPEYDLFVQASEHEGFGLSVIEAIAAQVPVYISDIPVFWEITKGKAHFFDLDDPEKAALFLRQLISDQKLRHQHVAGAFQVISENYTEEVYTKNLSNIYSKITGHTFNISTP